MERVLVITQGYCGKAAANGLCAQTLVKELQNRGVQVSVISCEIEGNVAEDNSSVIPVYYATSQKAITYSSTYISKVFRYIKRVIRYSFTPKYNKVLVRDVEKAAEEVICQSRPELVLCTFFPTEALLAGYRIAKKHPECKLVSYELDSVTDGIVGSIGRLGKYILVSYRLLLNRIYRRAKTIMILKCHENSWTNEYKRHSKKMRVVDLPLLCDNHYENDDAAEQSLRLLYSGALDKEYRSPAVLLAAFSALQEPTAKLEFYSRGCDEELGEAAAADERISCFGYVDQSTLTNAIRKADILLNIGNRVSNSLPSKLITYMTYGKPIIHFSLQENDVCVEYLKKYPLSLVIGKNDEVSETAERLKTFIQEVRGKSVPYEVLRHNFCSNLPSYSVDILLQDMG